LITTIASKCQIQLTTTRFIFVIPEFNVADFKNQKITTFAGLPYERLPPVLQNVDQYVLGIKLFEEQDYNLILSE